MNPWLLPWVSVQKPTITPGVAECLGRRAPRPGRVVDRGELPVLVEEPVKHVVGVEVCTGD